MAKMAVVNWSGTGNTEIMANEIAAGARGNGASVDVITCDSFGADQADEYDILAFGCPAMGSEELEDSEFEPMFSEVECRLAGKKVALFGSYDWGDGEWMRTWETRCKDAGIELAAEGLIANNTPDDEAVAACRALGGSLAE